jgi:DNA-binding NarL/FixJ family response regulator
MEAGFLRTMDLITVFIADAHPQLRRSLSRFLSRQDDIQVVGEAADGRQVLRRVEALQPYILLLDVHMPRLSGLDLLPSICARSPRTKILILADVFEEEFIVRALLHGVQGCVLKTTPPTELVKAIRTTHAGEMWAQRKLLTRVVENLRQQLEKLQGSLSGLREALSSREREVVSWAVQGMTNLEIAAELGISPKTVKTHLQNVFRKLNVRRRVQLPALAPHLAFSAPRVAPDSLHRERHT